MKTIEILKETDYKITIKNPNRDKIVELQQNLTVTDSEAISYRYKQPSKKISDLSDEQMLYQFETGRFFIVDKSTLDDIKIDLREKKKLNDIPFDHSLFDGLVMSDDSRIRRIKHIKDDIYHIEYITFNIEKSYCNEFSYMIDNKTLNYSYDENGDIVIPKYLFYLDENFIDDLSNDEILDRVKNSLLKIVKDKKFKRHNNIWYCDDYAMGLFTHNHEVTINKKQYLYTSSQGQRIYERSTKEPKKSIESNYNELVDYYMNLVIEVIKNVNERNVI